MFFDFALPEDDTAPLEVAKHVVYFTDHPPRDAVRDTMRRYLCPTDAIVYLYIRDGVWAIVAAEDEARTLVAIANGHGPNDEPIAWHEVTE